MNSHLTAWPGNVASQVKHSQADQLTQDLTNTYRYDASTFPSQDPIASVNRYAYGSGSPMNAVDPTGSFSLLGDSLLESVALGAVLGFGTGVVTCSAHQEVPIAFYSSEQVKNFVECVGSSAVIGAAGGAFGYGVGSAGFGGLQPGVEGYLRSVNALTPVFGCIALGIWNSYLDSQFDVARGEETPTMADLGGSFASGCGVGIVRLTR